MATTNVICIVPIKNEAWILKNFVDSARRWADVVIVGDNRSTDDSVSIARGLGCQVIDLGPAYDEANRRKRLIDEARKVPGKRLIFSIDADEMISANWAASAEWAQMRDATPGTRFSFDWIELLPGLKTCIFEGQSAAFVDDGSEYRGVVIHSPRIPMTAGKSVKLEEIKLLHYIAIDPGRMLSRHRWYKCLEAVEHNKRPWEICVRYQDTRMKTYDAPIRPVQEEWLKGYAWLDEYRAQDATAERPYWWDGEVLNYFDQYSVERFRKLNIWDVDWTQKAQLLGRKDRVYKDPRSVNDKLVHSFIERYREQLKLKKRLPFKLVDKLARTTLGWTGW